MSDFLLHILCLLRIKSNDISIPCVQLLICILTRKFVATVLVAKTSPSM